MIDRRETLLLGLAAVPVLCLAQHIAIAGGIHTRFYPLLIDLPGWEGAPPSGQASRAGEAVELMAVRHYVRDARDPCMAAILVGPQTKDVVATLRTDVQQDHREMRVVTTHIDGFKPRSTFLLAHDMGSIIVPLGGQAVFTLGFAHVGEAEAHALARRFDWKAMRAVLPWSAT